MNCLQFAFLSNNSHFIPKELLAHLGHYNQSIKLDAVNSIKEIVTSNSSYIKTEISNLLENLCPLFTDRDYNVREATTQLFKTVILVPDLNNKTLLKPFYELINVHLSCAMTHIVDNVQYSSLKILDILIEHMPDLIRTYAYSIFENFIDQISKLSTSKGDKRTLKNDPYKLTSTQSWRHNVLNRLYKMLIIVSKGENDQSSETDEHNDFSNKNTNEEKQILLDIDNGRGQIKITRSDNKPDIQSSYKIW